jgi:erythromycin esterase
LMDDFINNDALMEHRIGHRAVGVVYNSKYEQYSNYVPTVLPMRYDAFIYLDGTTALHPLHLMPDGHLTPETYPFGV